MNKKEQSAQIFQDENVEFLLTPLRDLFKNTFFDQSIFYVISVVILIFLVPYVIKIIFKEVF